MNKSVEFLQNYAEYYELYEYKSRAETKVPKSTFIKLAAAMKQKLKRWLFDEKGYIFALWLGFQIIVYVFTFVYYAISSDYRTMRSVVGYGLPTARSAAAVMNFNFGLMYLTMCPTFLTWLGQFRRVRHALSLSHAKSAHVFVSKVILIFGMVHCMAHWVNFVRVSRAQGVPAGDLLFLQPTGATGHAALFIVLPFSLLLLPFVRRRLFDAFFWIHQLHLPLTVVLMAHGHFCFIKSDVAPTCNTAGFWITTSVPLILYLCEKVFRFYKYGKPAQVLALIQHPGNTLEIRFKHPNFIRNGAWNFKAGQYMKILVPEISLFQWHPFTITSSPGDDFVSVHISCVGDWTKRLEKYAQNAKYAGTLSYTYCNVGMDAGDFLPAIYINGPFLAPADETRYYRTLVLIACGIGVTPFASVLRSFMSNEQKEAGMRIHFIWINREKSNFKWFYDLLREIESKGLSTVVEVSLYWTVKKVTESFCHKITLASIECEEDPITNLTDAKTYFGRPQWSHVFDGVEAKRPFGKIGVFFCGQEAVSVAINTEIEKRNKELYTKTKYVFHKEFF